MTVEQLVRCLLRSQRGQFRSFLTLQAGRGVLWAEGESHRRYVNHDIAISPPLLVPGINQAEESNIACLPATYFHLLRLGLQGVLWNQFVRRLRHVDLRERCS